ncbi:hypothetical protein CSB45_07025 [candidate division KSB3 bacterium]|uniref:Uncharacterized protein n=1 Tax=candidate division KSB3 bacterium TaxID=2044937 RepID=A0A2G6E6P9_9BACT|nr:MAG: hypothetical protein CSB45_07025 [candidate division KSB3 bacterium]
MLPRYRALKNLKGQLSASSYANETLTDTSMIESDYVEATWICQYKKIYFFLQFFPEKLFSCSATITRDSMKF